MVRCWELAALQATRPAHICICSCATQRAGLLTLMAGGAVALTHGSIISQSHYGLPIHRLIITDRESIHQVLRLHIRLFQRPVYLWTMADRASFRPLLNVGTISLRAVHRAGSCDFPERAPHPLPAQHNGICLRALTMVSILSTSASHRSDPPRKARSIPSVTQVNRIRSLSTRQSFPTSITSRMDGCTSANTTSAAMVKNTSNLPTARRMK